jgi:hypothetical protein
LLKSKKKSLLSIIPRLNSLLNIEKFPYFLTTYCRIWNYSARKAQGSARKRKEAQGSAKSMTFVFNTLATAKTEGGGFSHCSPLGAVIETISGGFNRRLTPRSTRSR